MGSDQTGLNQVQPDPTGQVMLLYWALDLLIYQTGSGQTGDVAVGVKQFS